VAFAFSAILYPHLYQFPLRLTFPIAQEKYGLTMFHAHNNEGLGPVSTPAAFIVRVIPKYDGIIPLHYLLVQAYQYLWLVRLNDVLPTVHFR
jgi:hypothetical protein